MRFIKYITFFLFLVLSGGKAFAQPTEEMLKNAPLEQKFDAAIELMDQKQYFQASKIWENILSEFPDNANYNYRMGICYLNMNLNKGKALPYLEKAKEKASKKFDPFSPFEERAPLDTYFYLGKAYHLNYRFDDAIASFEQFKTEAGPKHFLFPEIAHQEAMAQNAKYETENPRQQNSRITNLGQDINSPFSDFSPVISLDETSLFFTSRRIRPDSSNLYFVVPEDGKYYEDIYVSFKDKNSGKWLPAELLSISELRGNEATIGVSADGSRLFVYRDDAGDGNIYFSEFVDTSFTDLQEFGSDINTTSWETHATVTADGNTLYFVSDRPGGLGGRDIYRCKRLPNGQWSQAQNVGAPVNTQWDEDAPFISAGGKYLYFSSNSGKSMGGFDIFFSEFTEEGSFTEPVPIGVPINSVDDDVFFITSADGKRGYFSSEREDTYGEKDIYLIEFEQVFVEKIAILKGYINPGGGQQLPENILILVSDLTEGSDPEEYKPRGNDGSYVFALVPCHEYLVEYQIDGVNFHEYQFQVPCEASYQEIEKVLNLDPITMAVLEGPIVEDPFEQEDKYWQLKNLKPDQVDLTAYALDTDGKVRYNEKVDSLGRFKYRPIDNGNKELFEIRAKDKPLCDEAELVLVGKNKEVIGRTIRDSKCRYTYEKEGVVVEDPKNNNQTTTTETKTAVPVNYEKFYRYNKKGVTAEERDFRKFVEGVALLIEVNGKATIELEASASKVPTTTYKTNENLSKLRLEEARQRLIKALERKGVDASKLFFAVESSLVQGPEYNDDFIKNRDTYEKYQYIKISAK